MRLLGLHSEDSLWEGDTPKTEEAERKDAVFCFVKALQNKRYYRPVHNGRFYICLDGIHVQSSAGKGRSHEGKVSFICTEKRESAGRRLKIPIKRMDKLASDWEGNSYEARLAKHLISKFS
jgi:hypothetical protein